MALTLLCATANAQETYENAPLASKDLNGTARYVGMGGAMEALGADITTMGTNPAGIGMFRRSAASVSFGMITQNEANSFANADKYEFRSGRIRLLHALRPAFVCELRIQLQQEQELQPDSFRCRQADQCLPEQAFRTEELQRCLSVEKQERHSVERARHIQPARLSLQQCDFR